MAYTKKANNFKAYVQIPLTPGMVGEIQQMVLNSAGIIEAVGELVLAGFTIKISYEKETEACQLALIQMDETSADEGYGYYSSGETPEQAIASAYTKWRFLVQQKMRLSEVAEKGRPKLS